MNAEELTQKIWDDTYYFGEYSNFVKKYWEENDIHPDIRPGDMELLKQAKIDFFAINCYRSDVGKAPDNSYLQEIGLNKYGRKGEFVYTNRPGEYALDRNPFVETNDWDWHIDGVSMRYTMRYMWDHYHLPMVITEAGFGAHEDLDENGQIHDDYRIPLGIVEACHHSHLFAIVTRQVYIRPVLRVNVMQLNHLIQC
jgi:6-phospho-beta-glucosidase